jgi:hypothetical protein
MLLQKSTSRFPGTSASIKQGYEFSARLSRMNCPWSVDTGTMQDQASHDIHRSCSVCRSRRTLHYMRTRSRGCYRIAGETQLATKRSPGLRTSAPTSLVGLTNHHNVLSIDDQSDQVPEPYFDSRVRQADVSSPEDLLATVMESFRSYKNEGILRICFSGPHAKQSLDAPHHTPLSFHFLLLY